MLINGEVVTARVLVFLPLIPTVILIIMLNNPRTRPTGNSINNDGRRNGFVGDDPTILLIPQALDNQEWCSRFTSLKGKLKSEFSEMPSDIRVSKTFATLRGLCVGPEAVMSLNVGFLYLQNLIG